MKGMGEFLRKSSGYLILQAAVMIYSLTTVISKLVSEHDFLSFKWIALYILDFAVLGIYAIIWQQLLKRFDLSIAYANKAMTLLWSLLWSVILFREQATVPKIVGILLVTAGTIVLNSGPETSDGGKAGGKLRDSSREMTDAGGQP